MTYTQFRRICWDILGEMERRHEAFGGSMAEAVNDALFVAFQTLNGVRNYNELRATDTT